MKIVLVEFSWQANRILNNKEDYKNDIIVSLDPLSSYILKSNNIKCKVIYPIEKAFCYISDKAEKGDISIIFGSHYAAKSIYKFFEINFDNVSI